MLAQLVVDGNPAATINLLYASGDLVRASDYDRERECESDAGSGSDGAGGQEDDGDGPGERPVAVSAVTYSHDVPTEELDRLQVGIPAVLCRSSAPG